VIVRLRLQRIPEKHQQIDLAIGDPGADLLVAAEQAAAEAGDGQAGFLVKQAPGGTGGVQAMLAGWHRRVIALYSRGRSAGHRNGRPCWHADYWHAGGQRVALP
jgi:hypothetical protein